MKELYKASLLLLLLQAFPMGSFGQKRNLANTLSLGVSRPMLDKGIGLHLGLNSAYPINSTFSVEGQLSYLHTWVLSSFLSGETGKVKALNTLVGGRYYLITNNSRNRFFLSLLIGGNREITVKKDQEMEEVIRAGYSAGAFFCFNKWWIGLSYETPQNIVLKWAYRL